MTLKVAERSHSQRDIAQQLGVGRARFGTTLDDCKVEEQVERGVRSRIEVTSRIRSLLKVRYSYGA